MQATTIIMANASKTFCLTSYAMLVAAIIKEFIESNILDLQNFVLNDFSIIEGFWQAVLKNMWQIILLENILAKNAEAL